MHEPVERVTIDVPEDYLGVVTQLLALRKGRLEQMVNHGTGWVRMEYIVPARGLIGFRTEFLTETRGTGMLHHVFERYEPWHGELRTRPTGSLVADRRGVSNTFALMNLQERGQMLVGPGVEVYEGMIVGENARSDEMDVNPTKEKKLTNMRAAGSDDTVRLVPPRPMSLEQALEFIADDECVEVTPRHRAPAQGRSSTPAAWPRRRTPSAPEPSRARPGSPFTASADRYHRVACAASAEPDRVPAGSRSSPRSCWRSSSSPAARCASPTRGSAARRGRTARRAGSPRTSASDSHQWSSREPRCSPGWCRSR